MSTLDLAGLQDELRRQDVLISFSGPFSHGIIEELGKAVRHYLESAQVARSTLMDVFAVYIEQAQNVGHYVCRQDAGSAQARLASSGIVVIAQEDQRCVVSSGNLLDRADAPALIARLERLRSLDKAGLKALYKAQMRLPLTPQGGAGLGLIEMARKATMPLEYAFGEVDEQYVFFSLRVVI
ncbi:MAG: SiaB family protein kinase [Candidatus Competibacteraceae bacterium]|jgi:hypothetical protein